MVIRRQPGRPENRDTVTLVITIDGPVAAGKTTLARRLAARLKFTLLDTGAIYRAVAYQCHERGVEWTDEPCAREIATELDLEFRTVVGQNRVFVGGFDVSAAIRKPLISHGASLVSALQGVRQALLDLQRSHARTNDVIAEGRDTGTVVFPQAELKIFLTAAAEQRAKRRFHDHLRLGTSQALEQVLEDLLQRDERDTQRETAPLCPAAEAILIDNSDLTIEGTEAEALSHFAALHRIQVPDSVGRPHG